MTEDLNLSEIINDLRIYVDNEVIPKISENAFLATSLLNLVSQLKDNLENDLKDMIDGLDQSYLNILINELSEEKEFIKEEKSKDEGEDNMFEGLNEIINQESTVEDKIDTSKFDKYDDMTLFNKVILSLNTAEEKLARKESKLEKDKAVIEQKLTDTNKDIETNIKRENELSQRKLELNEKEIELNSKLSETEVIFLNMKPLIKGLNKIKDATLKGGLENE